MGNIVKLRYLLVKIHKALLMWFLWKLENFPSLADASTASENPQFLLCVSLIREKIALEKLKQSKHTGDLQ